jgi:TonB family protein
MHEIPESGGRPGAAIVPGKNRRVHTRQRVVSLTYIDLGESNGGIVLNVSETGIGIQAVEMLEDAVSVRLQLPGSKKRLEVRTEVAWIGPSKKEAGLRFVDLSQDTLKQIRTWIACEASPYAFGRHNGNYFFEPTPVPVSPAAAQDSIAEAEPVTNPESAASTEHVTTIPDQAVRAAEEIKAQAEALTQSESESLNAGVEAPIIESPEIGELEAGRAEAAAIDSIAEYRTAEDSSFDVQEAQDQNIEAAAFEALAIQGEADTSALPEALSSEADEVTAAETAVIVEHPQSRNEATAVQADAEVTGPLELQTKESKLVDVRAVEAVGALVATPQLGEDKNAPGLEADNQELSEIRNREAARAQAIELESEVSKPKLLHTENTEGVQAESAIVENERRNPEFADIRTAEYESVLPESPLARSTKPQPIFWEAAVETTATRTEFPAPAFNTIKEPRSAPSATPTNSASTALRDFPAAPKTPLFVAPHILSQTPNDDPWKSFRVQTHGGWFVASIFFLAAAISFVAGMAVRRGTLDEVTNRFGPPIPPPTVPAQTPNQIAAAHSPAPVSATSSDSTPIAADAPAKSLDIEIVDSTGRRCTIPATVGSSRATISSAPQAGTQEFTATNQSAPENRPTTISQPTPKIQSSTSQPTLAGQLTSPSRSPAQSSPRISQPPPASTPVAISSPAPASSNTQSVSTPLIVPLPETPISATGSIAIRSRGSITVPPGVAPPSPDGRNLRTGQLTDVVEPYYPPEAQQLHIEGIVKLHAVIDADGTVQSVEPLGGPDLLMRSAMSAVRQWKYTPTTLNGKPVGTQQDVTFVFRLPN